MVTRNILEIYWKTIHIHHILYAVSTVHFSYGKVCLVLILWRTLKFFRGFNRQMDISLKTITTFTFICIQMYSVCWCNQRASKQKYIIQTNWQFHAATPTTNRKLFWSAGRGRSIRASFSFWTKTLGNNHLWCKSYSSCGGFSFKPCISEISVQKDAHETALHYQPWLA